MSEQQFWISVWKIVGACFCVFVLSATGCTMHETYRLSKVADPLAYSCAKDRREVAAACLVLAKQK